MNILVTGGAGQLGSYLLDKLSAGHEVRALDIREPLIEEHLPLISHVDIRDQAAVERECEWADAVVHAAAQVSVERSIEEPEVDADINIIGTLSMLKAAALAGVGVFVYISSAAVYGNPKYLPVDEAHPRNPKSPYGISKLTGEEYVRVYGECRDLDYMVIRPFNFYSSRADPGSPYSGVITKFVSNLRSGQPIFIEGDGEQIRDFVHALDVAEMVKLALESQVRNLTMNCGSGKGTSINELAEVFASIREDVEVKHVAPRTGDIRHSIADISLARDFVGYEPKIPLREGLASFF
ncbi:MAG: NAD-dependent epimerase/dehydratase family protein [Euryarchaeota archaeon]|nr:NAD-dependent epimerase/dehydratase family protein [Euryarchaeota archaeon]